MEYFTGDFYSDSAIMYDVLDSLYLRTGYERSGTKFFAREKKCRKADSMKVGWTWRKRCGDKDREFDEEKGLYKTVLLSENPNLMNMFKEYSDHHFNEFEWSEITINRMPSGTSIKEHLDKKNVGDSILVAFGDYNGGRTFVKDGTKYNIHDARKELIKFNGSEKLHSVNTVSDGIRYSLVFYKNNYKKKKKY